MPIARNQCMGCCAGWPTFTPDGMPLMAIFHRVRGGYRGESMRCQWFRYGSPLLATSQ